MTKSEFIRILKDPSLMSKDHTFDLEDVVSDFPFFQAARVLYLKGLKSQNSFRYNQSLKTTAVYTNERSVLFAFISSNDYNLPTQQKNEQAFINEIGIQDQQVLDQIYKKDTDDTISELPTLENEPEIEITEEPLFKIATKVEKPIEVIEDTVDFQSQDEFTFELLPKEIFEETILDEPIVKKLEVTLSEEFCPPVQFNQNDTHSFSDWLKISSFKPIDRYTEPVKKVSLEEKLDLIEEFIVKNPKIEPIKEKTIEESAKPQITENEEIMTETLARVYVLQHKYADAISAYQILSLKFPEKSSFFADQIKQIEVLRRNNF